MKKMKIATRIFLCLMLAGFLSACGGGGGGSNAFTPMEDNNSPMVVMDDKEDSSGILSEEFLAAEASGFLGGDDPEETVADLKSRNSGGDERLSFYDQLLSGGVEATGNAGTYKLVVNAKEYPHLRNNRQYNRAVASMAVYNYVVMAWHTYTYVLGGDIGGGASAYYPAYVWSRPVPITGAATYDLEGRAFMTKRENDSYDSVSEYYEVIMTGRVNANFSDDTVGGYMESNYGYKFSEKAAGAAVDLGITHITRDITREKYFGEIDSELSGGVRIEFADGRLLGYDEIFRSRWTDHRFNVPACQERNCFGGELHVREATGDFAGLGVTGRLGGYGTISGIFAGYNHDEVFGKIDLQNEFPGEGVPIVRLLGGYVGTKQSESE